VKRIIQVVLGCACTSLLHFAQCNPCWWLLWSKHAGLDSNGDIRSCVYGHRFTNLLKTTTCVLRWNRVIYLTKDFVAFSLRVDVLRSFSHREGSYIIIDLYFQLTFLASVSKRVAAYDFVLYFTSQQPDHVSSKKSCRFQNIHLFKMKLGSEQTTGTWPVTTEGQKTESITYM
jgi:hypothetical protein